MTVRVTTLKGPDAGAYYVEHLPRYYLAEGEPQGRWQGLGAGSLGLGGDVADDPFMALMAGLDPRDPQRSLGNPYDERSVRGFDVTASAPKSVSLLFALGSSTIRQHAVAAHDAAVAAMVDWIEQHAHTRYRISGQIAVVDAHGIIAAQFRQHTSRALDPQLHTHVVIPNRVKSPDGRWLALDARTIKRDQRTLSALYHAGLRAELTARLGVRWNDPVNGIAEIADLPEELLGAFSARTDEVRRRLDDKLDRFATNMQRPPTVRERWRLEREAVVQSRPAKVAADDPDSMRRAWIEQAAALGWEQHQLLPTVIERARRAVKLDPTPVIDRAIATLTERQSTWRPAEATREIAAALPTNVALSAADTVAHAEHLADRMIRDRCHDISRPVEPCVPLRRDGRPVTEASTDRALTTVAILRQEESIVAWAERRLAAPGGDCPEATRRGDDGLTAAQAHVAAKVAGHDHLVVVVGPAGAGKTTALRPAVAELHARGRAVFGVAPSANAATVLADETGADADTIDKLIVEHGLARPPQHRYDLPAGATVIVDEAGMMSTARFAALAQLADDKGWRLALIGDPLQFTAVGRGGMFGHLVERFDAAELDRIHRFTEDWERQASLRLRRGDTDVASVYNVQGRLHGGTCNEMERRCVEEWWRRRVGSERSLLMATTNEAVDRLNRRAQRLRIQRCELDHAGPRTETKRQTIVVGDEIATRHNDRSIRTDRGIAVKNRATWTVTSIRRDGSIVACGKDGNVELPADYVREHVDLAYAVTVMGAQGRTVKHAMLLIDRPTDVRGLYVGMSRGTTTNDAYIAIDGEDTAVDIFERCLASDWIDHPAITRRAELSNDEEVAGLSVSTGTLAVASPRPMKAGAPEPDEPTPDGSLELQEMVRNSAGAKILAEWERITYGEVRPDELAVKRNAPLTPEPVEPPKSAAEQILEEWARKARRPPERPGPGHGLSL
ncbi:MAG: relaxase domain-containing protein [Actinomycetota bacterium]|nr:relaxase domain-containing protein [Actinomycetota bacterium]